MPTRKLIEVALPLEVINQEAALRKRKAPAGYPTTLHTWFAQRPLAACRAVLFASLVDDPSSHPDRFPTEEAQQRERERLFGIIERLVKWENSTNEHVLRETREEILKHTGNNPPPVYDPFAGGGSIPLEAQRLGLDAHASDLNPVAVLINKALIEIPPRFANMPPVNPEDRNRIGADWKGAAGLAADVRYYGKWMRDEAEKHIGHLYPKVKLPKEYGGGEATAVAWLWARTVTCPNPACGAQMPLVRSFTLSTKKGREAWVEPVIEQSKPPRVRFMVKSGIGSPPEPPKLGRGASFRCLCCGNASSEQHIKTEAKASRMGVQLIAIVAEGKRGRIYVSPNEVHEQIMLNVEPVEFPSEPLANDPRNIWCVNYGLDTFGKLFNARQLVSLTTFSNLVNEARLLVQQDVEEVRGMSAKDYASGVATYLAFVVSRLADYGSTLSSWRPKDSALRSTLARQAIPMVWDYAEGNFFASSSAGIIDSCQVIAKCIEVVPAVGEGHAIQVDAQKIALSDQKFTFSTDPPYYDNITYADLSDFFYIWLRRSLMQVYPELFRTLLVPKAEELIASPYRFEGSKEKAERFFEQGLGQAFAQMRAAQRIDFPLTVYYAFKQSESDKDEDSLVGQNENALASTGWETMLEGLIGAGFTITGTWPMRTEGDNRQIGRGANALASSIVLVCRPRPEDARAATRREFLNALKAELPGALRRLQQGNIAPVDLAQAAIGPGMAVFSRYSKVVESDGSPMRVRTALQIINQELDAVLAEQEGEFDGDTRWAIAWFDQYGVNEGPYGVAETLSKAKNTSVEGMVEAGIVVARSGKVRLLSRDELPADWDPGRDRRVTVWEVAQHLVHALDKCGEGGAAALLAQLGGEGEIARDLAYRLYTTCERKGWAQEALAYNSLVVAWPEIRRLAAEAQRGGAVQGRMEI
jgi:putative DNA methylase